jgi:uncharacterized protein YyaL (SSP411 family)
MAHESFENGEIARLMNESFINIKVDREERPDLDTVYMKSVQAMTGSGGWPLTVFLTPDGRPFFGGTYFPPEDRFGMAGFTRVLGAVTDAYRNRRAEVEQAIGKITAVLTAEIESGSTNEPLVVDTLGQAYMKLKQDFDQKNAGFGPAPKFPQPLTLEFLLRHHQRTGDNEALAMVELTLERMARGGIYDQVGGGFHRYATDSRWLVPHFEKTLYDNAQLSQLYLHAYLVTGKQFYRSIAEETLDYVLREMIDSKGGFYSTQDADSEGVEGKYYLWTAQEIVEVVGEGMGQTVSEYFGVTAEGNFEGGNILHVAKELVPEAVDIVRQAKVDLLNKRGQRVEPGRDEKVLASWNGLMLNSMAEAACVLGRQDYLAAAEANGSFILDSMIINGHLKHTFKNGQAKIDGYLEDYAMVIDGFLALHQATFVGDWLRQSIKLGQVIVEEFWDEAKQMFYDSDQHQKDLFVRPRSTFDGALPCGTSAATMALLKLAKLSDNSRFEQVATQSLRSVQSSMSQYPLGLSNWLCVLDFYLSQSKEIVIIGPRNGSATLDLLNALYSTWLPNKVIATYDPNDPNPVSELALFENRSMIDGQPTIYVCQNYTCQEPATDPASLSAKLRGI